MPRTGESVKVKCQNKYCGKRTRVSKLVYISTHWYESPYSCTGGDRWHFGGGDYICPKCLHRNRSSPTFGDPLIEELRRYFHHEVEEYTQGQYGNGKKIPFSDLVV